MSFEFDFKKAAESLVPDLTDSLLQRMSDALKEETKYHDLASAFGISDAKTILMSSIAMAISTEMTVKVLQEYHKELNSYLENQK
jgi:hypothetical protein